MLSIKDPLQIKRGTQTGSKGEKTLHVNGNFKKLG